jgi:hypothetical protein
MEVVSIRHVSGIAHAITVRHRSAVGFLSRLFGRKDSFTDRVYIGNHVWRDAATGARVGLFMADWLQEVLAAKEARDLYRSSGYAG